MLQKDIATIVKGHQTFGFLVVTAGAGVIELSGAILGDVPSSL